MSEDGGEAGRIAEALKHYKAEGMQRIAVNAADLDSGVGASEARGSYAGRR